MSSANNKRIAKNTLFLYFRMLLTTCIGLYTSRIVLQTLGVVDFGIYNVVGGVVALFSFINTSMATSTQRFITYALGEGDEYEVNKIYSASVIIHILIAIIVVTLSETLGLWFMLNKMQIPQDRLTAALWAYQFSVLSISLSILRVPFNSLIISYEKMSVFAYISIVEVVLKLLIVYLLQIGTHDKLIMYAFLMALVSIIINSFYYIYCKKSFVVSKFRIVKDKNLFMQVLGFSMWNINGSLAMVGATQGLNILLNMFFGPAVNAARGIAVQVQSHIYTFCANFQVAAKPQITKLYANKDYFEMHKLVMSSSRFSYYLMLLLSFPVMLNLSAILEWWLGIVPAYTEQFVIVMLLTSFIRSLALPLFASVHATGNIKRFQLWEGTTLLLVVPIAYLLLRFFHINPTIVMYVYFFMELIAQFIRIWIVLPMIHLPYKIYMKETILPVVYLTIAASLILSLQQVLFSPKGVAFIFISSLINFLLTGVCIYFIGCKSGERQMLMIVLKNKFNSLMRLKLTNAEQHQQFS